MTSTAISAQGSTLQIGNGSATAKAISALVAGFPTIVSSAAHGLANGTRVTLSGFTGADAALLNGVAVTVKNATANTYAFDIDTTSKVPGATGTATPSAYVKIGNFKTFSGFDGEASEIDVTNLDSVAHEIRLGLIDNGKFSIDVDWDGTDAGQLLARAAQVSGAIQNFRLTLPNGAVASYTAFVKSFPVSLGVDQVVKSTIGFRISGAVTWA